MNKILENIEKIRKDKGFSQIELSQMLGIKQSAYSRMLTNTDDIKLSTLQHIATKLNVSVVDFFIYPDIYDEIASYAHRCQKEVEEFARLCNKCADFALIYSSFFDRIDEDYPELALLDIQQPLKDLIAGRISIEQYKALKHEQYEI